MKISYLFTSRMKLAKRSPKENHVRVTISMPSSLLGVMRENIKEDPELDASKYLRRLIRRDLESQKRKAAK